MCVSMAVCKAGAKITAKPLYQHIADVAGIQRFAFRTSVQLPQVSLASLWRIVHASNEREHVSRGC